MRALALAGLSAMLAGCNLVFGLDPGSGGDDDVPLDGGDDAADGGGDRCATPATLLCTRFDGVLDDGFQRSVIGGGAALGLVTDAPRFARSQFIAADDAVQASLNADRAGRGPVFYRLTFRVRGGLGCAEGSLTDPTDIDILRLNLPGPGISIAIGRQLDVLRFSVSSGAGTTSVPLPVSLTDFRAMQLDLNFPGDKMSWFVDDNLAASVDLTAEPASQDLIEVVVGARAQSPAGDCQLDYDDVILTAGSADDDALQLRR